MTANLVWTKLLGTPEEDYGSAVTTTTSGFIYLTGTTIGDLQGNTNNGVDDIFISKLNQDGHLLWTRLSGSSSGDVPFSITESNNGNIYISGVQGSRAFITQLSPDGDIKWNHLASDSQNDPGFSSVATEIKATADNGAYVTGYQGGKIVRSQVSGTIAERIDYDYDAFLQKINSSGEIEWTTTLASTANDQASSLAIGIDGSIYITGITSGNLDGETNGSNNPSSTEAIFETFIAKFNSAGEKQWTRLTGRSTSTSIAVTNDGSAYVTGSTSGDLNGEINNGSGDAFVSKYDSSGNRVWTRLIGTSQGEFATSITTDSGGSIYITGTTNGVFPGQNAGGTVGSDTDIFLAKLANNGNLKWVVQYGSENGDEPFSVATSGNGAIFITGGTYGNLGGQQNAGLAAGRLDADAFVIRYNDPAVSNSTNTEPTNSSTPQSATPTPLTTAAPATAGVDPIPESQPSISPPPPAPPSSSPILGIEPQETVKTVGLQTPLVIGSLKINQVVVGTAARDLITGSYTAEALAGGQGKDKMTGGGGSDAFVFETPGEFGKKKTDTITDFRPEEGDKIAIAKETFSEVSRIKLDTATGKQETRTAASTNKNFIYDDKSGILYFNENGRKAGFGNGGEFAQLLGVPDISKGDLVLL